MNFLAIALAALTATLAVALPNAPTMATSDHAVLPPFHNSHIFTYACDPVEINTINRLLKLNIKVFTTSFYQCPNSNCYQFDTGATCSVPSIDIQARAPDLREDKHYKCSRDGASVLICRYGFCSTDQYCNLNGHGGAYCHDDCACCKKGRTAEGVGQVRD